MRSPFRSLLVFATLGFVLAVGACSKPDAGEKQPGQAFLDSQIPPGLAPQYFPPQGFVWGAYKTGNLPEARYGVASPPVNPRAQVLILADADYPAETYFELANQLIDEGLGVWLFEVPGQGGAGQYKGQDQTVFTRSYRDGQTAIMGFVRDIVHPTAEKPLFIIGTGFSAVNALSLSTTVKDGKTAGFIAYAPYLGGQIDPGKTWHRETQVGSYWGGIAHNWRISNPDLRLSVKSEAWQEQTRKAYTDINSLHLPVISLTAKPVPVLLLEPRDGSKGVGAAATTLCARLAACKANETSGPETLAADVTDFIRAQLPISG